MSGDEEPKAELVLVATPIGNLGDLSPRAVEVLSRSDLWIVEDSRVSGKLASHLGLKKPMRIVNDHTSPEQIQRILDEVADGKSAALLTDGGTPVVSDPGAILADQCYRRGISVDGVPGPSAPTLALSLSGFFGQRYAFLGFLGRKPGDIRKELAPFNGSPLTLVLFESPHRIDTLLATAHEALGERRYAVCREMTKSFQQIYRNSLPTLPTAQELPRKGELTVVLEGLRRKPADDSRE